MRRVVFQTLAWLALAVLPPASGGASTAPQEQPLPDLKPFLAEVHRHLASNQLAQLNYTYQEKVTDVSRDDSGRVTKTRVRVFEIYPAADDEMTYRRLMSVDGMEVPREELEQNDRDQEDKVRAWLARTRQEGESARQKRTLEEAEVRRKEEAIVDEVMQMFVIRLLWREMIDGRPAISVMFTPDSTYKPRGSEAKLLRRFQGRAWFDEEDHELVRLEARAMDDATIALGFVARLDKGSRARFERRKHADGVWLPVLSHFDGTGRLLLVKRIDVDRLSEFSNYRRYSADNAPPFALPRK